MVAFAQVKEGRPRLRLGRLGGEFKQVEAFTGDGRVNDGQERAWVFRVVQEATTNADFF